MTPAELELLLQQDEGPKLEFKLEYSLEGQGRDRQMDEVAKDILSLANSTGQDPSYLILGASDKVDEKTGRRSARSVRGQNYSLSRFLDIVNSRCTPPMNDVTYEEIEFGSAIYGILKICSSIYRPHHCTRDLVTPNARWPKNSVLVRRGDKIGVATPTEINQLAKEAAAAELISKPRRIPKDPLKGVHAIQIRTPLDFKSTLGADAVGHAVLFKATGEEEREMRNIIRSIFSDLQYIDQDEVNLAMSYLDSIEEPLESLNKLGAEIFCVIIPKLYQSSGKSFLMNIANYFFIPQDCYLARADVDSPTVHRFSDTCREAVLDIVANIRSERQIELYGALLKVWKKYGMEASWCSTCCAKESKFSKLLQTEGYNAERLEELAEFLKKENRS